MKLQVAAALCVLMLVASEMTQTSEAAGCDIMQLAPCVAASKNAQVAPTRKCCDNISKMGQGASGAKCLCSLLSQPLAKAQGVNVRIALGIPQRCRIAVPEDTSALESAFLGAKRISVCPGTATGSN